LVAAVITRQDKIRIAISGHIMGRGSRLNSQRLILNDVLIPSVSAAPVPDDRRRLCAFRDDEAVDPAVIEICHQRSGLLIAGVGRSQAAVNG
jgi:hypothetical protein